MTKEEIEDNYEFRVVKRLLKKEFPFIKDIYLTENWDEYKSVLFIDTSVDPNEVYDYLGIPRPTDDRSYLWYSIFSKGAPFLSLISSSDGKDIRDSISELDTKIRKTIGRIQTSPSIPPDMKLPKPLDISSYILLGDDTMTTPN